MTNKNKRPRFEELEFTPNRELMTESPVIAEKNEKFCFKDGFYFNRDQGIILRTSFAFGRIFKPVQE